MKVRVTTELSNKDRLIIGAQRHGQVGEVASHAECVAFLEDAISTVLSPMRTKWDAESREIVEAIKSQMGMGS